MRIAFDGTTLRPGRTGVGYYTEHLARHLAEAAQRTGDELIVVSNAAIETSTPLPANARLHVDTRCSLRLLWLQLFAPSALASLRPDVAHFTNSIVPLASRVPMVATIHDMSLTLYPGYHPWRRSLLNRPLVNLAAARVNAVITVSRSAKHDIVELYGLPSERVHVVHEAASPAFRPIHDRALLDATRARLGLPERFLLYVGTIEPRKNLPRLFDAFAAARHRGDLPHHLVCVGPYGWGSRDLHHKLEALGIAHVVHFTGYVPFDTLPVIYNLAEIFVFPSLYEGFGLPVVEAMACGLPVVTASTSSLAEIAADALETVDPLDTDVLTTTLLKLATDEPRRRLLAERSLGRSRDFSWSKAAEETLEIYRSVVEQARPARAYCLPVSVRQPTADEMMPLSKPEGHAATALPRSADHSHAAPAPDDRASVDVLFGQAYYLRFDTKLWEAQQPYAPLGTLYAAAYVRAAGYGVALFDAMLAQSEADWLQALDAHRPRFAVLYEDNFNYLSKMCLLRMRQAAVAMIAAARERGCLTIVAGSDATDHPDVYLDAGAQFVVAGEGELTLTALLDTLTGRREGVPQDVPGLCFRTAKGQLQRSPAATLIRDLDALPLPAWDLVDVERYRRMWEARHGYFSMNLATTRGCPYHCNWCAKPLYGQRYTARTAHSVVEEIAWLSARYAPDHVWIADDIFGLKPGWIEEFADGVVARGNLVPFKCLLRADLVTSRIASALARAGCRTVWIGAESGSQRILDAMEKGTTIAQIESATAALHDAGIEVGFFLQFGYPGEDRADIALTLEMVRRCRPDDIGVSVSYPLPGTPFYERVEAQMGDKRNWFDSADLTPMYRAAYSPAFYRTLHAVVHKEHRRRRALPDLIGLVKEPLTAPRRARQVLAAVFHALTLPLERERLRRLATRDERGQGTPTPPAAPSPRDAAMPAN